jgi:hypothetical protein
MADWLELRALVAADRSVSVADLRRALMAVGGDDGIATGKRATGTEDEILAQNALAECKGREIACGAGYPFTINGSLITRKSKVRLRKAWPYIFCLLLSLKGANRGDAEDSPTALFEEIAEIAARTYISGVSVKFGFPRRVMPAGFADAVDMMCKTVGEGRGCKRRPSAQTAKDARLDIVAWRPFPDKRPAQLLLFGQCAAGGNWTEKLAEMQPRGFTDIYWIDPPFVEPVKAFFTPFSLPQAGWEETSKQCGILFERCRITHFSSESRPPAGVLNWSRVALRELKK